MTEVNLGRFAKALGQPVFVAVGFGVLGSQRAQVCRRGLHQGVNGLAGTALAGTKRLGDELGERLEPLRHAVNGAAGDVLEHLPMEARDLLKAAGNLVGDLPHDAHSLADEVMALGRFALHVVRSPAARRPYP
jgi:hypothetical protein